jgi:hypothetical protein
VIEVEHNRIRLAAVDAGVLVEVLPDSDAILGDHALASDPDAIDHRFTILEIPAMLIIGRARATQPVPNAGLC